MKWIDCDNCFSCWHFDSAKILDKAADFIVLNAQ